MPYLMSPSGNIVGVSTNKVADLKKQGFKTVDANRKMHNMRFVAGHNKHDGYGQSGSYIKQFFNGITSKIKIYYSVPDVLKYSKPDDYNVLYTMFESSDIPLVFREHLHKADLIIVPSKYCYDIFSKYHDNVKIVQLGYNSNHYYYVPREKSKKFRILHYEAFNLRKGFDIVLEAFEMAFSKYEDVELVLKTVRTSLPFPIIQNNISVIRGKFDTTQMRDLIASCDLFLYPSRGEGFGMPPLEALAVGRMPVIAKHSGVMEYYDPDYMYGVDANIECTPVYSSYKKEECGHMKECTSRDLADVLLRAYTMRDYNEKALAKYAQKFTLDKTVENLAKVIHESYRKDKRNKKR